MDAPRFDQLARSLALGASRRRILKGLAGGAVAGWVFHRHGHRVRAQCSWTGTFQTTFGGITMSLTEAAGQISGTYTFTEHAVQTSGVITGAVRPDFPDYTVLDGSWREPAEGGRLWFTMAEPCTHFTGWYTSTDGSSDWIAGGNGVRTDGGAPTGTAEATYFINPGDTRAAQFTMDGQTATLFGPKDPDGGVQTISQASISAAGGDPEQQVLLDFDPSGTPTRATLARGDTMSFEWLSPTSVIVTYLNADGSQEMRFPYEATATAIEAAIGHSRQHGARAGGASEVRLFAYTDLPHPVRTVAASRLAPASAQTALGNPGVLEVRCGGGELVGGATVTGRMSPTSAVDVTHDVSFTETSPGRFGYSLPIAPAPAAGEGFHRTRVERALTIICLGNTAMLLTQASKEFVCATLLSR